MKNHLFIIIIVFSMQCFAQDPQLFENTWYLQNVIIESMNNYPPVNEEVGSVEAFFKAIAYGDFVDGFDTFVCDNLTGLVDYNNQVFSFTEPLEQSILGCELQVNQDFQTFYFGFYYVNLTEPFNYSITTESNGSKTLVVTSNSGDQAIYGNELLSNQEFDASSFKIYPNPVKEVLNIIIQHDIALNSIRIYDILGRLVIEEYGNVNQLDVSQLDSGVLFVEIDTDKGVLFKKIVKN